MSNGKEALIIGLGALAIASILIAVHLHNENKLLGKKILDLEQDKLKLILDSLKRNPNLTEEIKHQLEKMINDFKTIDKVISNQLASALQLLHLGQVERAIQDLVKIMEHLLTVHYKDNANFHEWLKKLRKRTTLHNLLTFCKEENKINEIEYQFFIAVKTIRNKEVHTIGFKLDGYLNASGLITAIGGIFKLASIVYPNKPHALAVTQKIQMKPIS